MHGWRLDDANCVSAVHYALIKQARYLYIIPSFNSCVCTCLLQSCLSYFCRYWYHQTSVQCLWIKISNNSKAWNRYITFNKFYILFSFGNDRTSNHHIPRDNWWDLNAETLGLIIIVIIIMVLTGMRQDSDKKEKEISKYYDYK